MRQVYSGTGVNTTATVQAWLNTSTSIIIRNLIIVGRPESPYALYMTDHEAPLSYGLYPAQNFKPATFTRGDILSKVGLDADSVDLTWSPGPNTYAQNVAAADPRVLSRTGFYDNWLVTFLAGFMPTPGDVNTYGCTTLFKGLISGGQIQIDRQKIKLPVISLMSILDQQVPTNVIEATNSLASYTAARPPTGFSTVPYFDTFTGSTNSIIYGDVKSPFSSHHIFPAHSLQNGWLIFIPGTGSTLPGFWSTIADNTEFIDGSSVHHNQFQLYSPVPWPPMPVSGGSGDTFLVSSPVPTVGEGYPFQYVPSPELNV